ncbi:exopolysaccharide synthesis protein [Thioclava sp. SK-1]|uniref:exopolysaccharide biosynthesis protein n=1 Tax=Thioclava sp. SK-1 TaxID=1889770 RepID=UPI000824EA37|nr:exopolysaccharide biosynthesis protein [Thioclava sp. SK-1]OCX66974.1 exopolysaccharide synthesis protein [Thioclava sp. SK-1]
MDIETPQALNETRPVSDILDRLHNTCQGRDSISLETLLNSLGGASFVPVLMVPALAVVSPLSGIPLFSSVCGILIALISAQMLVGRQHLWLPRWITSRRLTGEKLRAAIHKLRKPATWVDHRVKERLIIFTHRPFRWITQSCILLCGLVMPVLELVPFTSSIMGFAVTLMALSLLVRDGLIAVLGLAFVVLAGFVGYTAAGDLAGLFA